MTVGELCNRDVVVTGRDECIVDAAKRMRMFHVGDLIVVEARAGGRVPVGILTDRDIVLSVVASGAQHLPTLTVGDVMSDDLVTARESEDASEALRRMQARGVRRLPIVDEQGALAGILTLDDLLQSMARELADMLQLIAAERQQEVHLRV